MTTEYVTTTRSGIIDALCQSMCDDIEMNMEKLGVITYQGFKGYSNYTDEELIKEYMEYLSEDPDADIFVLLERGVA